MSFNNVNVNVSGGQSIIKALQNYNTVILKPNIVDNRNVLTQEMMSERHTKYVIRWNYSLEGATINVPEDCIIEFAGGTIDNGTIVGDNTIMIYNKPIDEVCPAERQGTFIYNTTVADEEDITSASGRLKFKDRPATDGMGRRILRKNIVDGVNTLTQEMMSDANTIYIIQYDFTLGEDITVPENCVLEFDGGSLANGTLDGQFTIKDCNYHIFKNIDFVPNSTVLHNDFLRPEWFGAKGDFKYTTKVEDFLVGGIGTDDSDAFTECIATSIKVRVNRIKLQACTYYISKGIDIHTGHLLIEGEYAGLRGAYAYPESSSAYPGNPYVNYDMTSCLYSDNCQSIINIVDNTDTTPSDKPAYPITFKNINFFNYSKNNKNAIGINFGSTWGGPLWPFIVERCSFTGFDKAIYFDNNSNPAYLVYEVRIRSCAFVFNNWCVYFKDNEGLNIDETAHLPIQHTWVFEFTDNNADHNTNVLCVMVARGSCIIQRNNMQSKSQTMAVDCWDAAADQRPATTQRQSYIALTGGATLHFTDNHLEDVNYPAFRLTILGDAHVNIGDNCCYMQTITPHIDVTPVMTGQVAENSNLYIDKWIGELYCNLMMLPDYGLFKVINNCAYVPDIRTVGDGTFVFVTNVLTTYLADNCYRKLSIFPEEGKEYIKDKETTVAYRLDFASDQVDNVYAMVLEGNVEGNVGANNNYNQNIFTDVDPYGCKIKSTSDKYKYSCIIYRGTVKGNIAGNMQQLTIETPVLKRISAALYNDISSDAIVEIKNYAQVFDEDKISWGDIVSSAPTSL